MKRKTPSKKRKPAEPPRQKYNRLAKAARQSHAEEVQTIHEVSRINRRANFSVPYLSSERRLVDSRAEDESYSRRMGVADQKLEKALAKLRKKHGIKG